MSQNEVKTTWPALAPTCPPPPLDLAVCVCVLGVGAEQLTVQLNSCMALDQLAGNAHRWGISGRGTRPWLGTEAVSQVPPTTATK